MPSFGRGGARSGSMIGRRNLPGTGRGFNGSLLRTRVGRTPWALARAKARRDRARSWSSGRRHDGPVALRRRRDDDAPQPRGRPSHADGSTRDGHLGRGAIASTRSSASRAA